MNIIFRELTSFQEFRATLPLQESVLGFGDIDKLSPLILNVFARDYPPMGLVVGAFDKDYSDDKPIGIYVAITTGILNSYYSVFMGILPQYRGKQIGFSFFCFIREVILKRGGAVMFYIYEVLDAKLANLYFNKLNVKGVRYNPNIFEFTDNGSPIVPNDSMLIRWDLDSQETGKKINGQHIKQPFEEIIQQIEESKQTFTPESSKVLIEIPKNFSELKKKEPDLALTWRLQTRDLFDLYMNKRGYIATEFYRIENGAHNYYLLEKSESQNKL